MDFALASRATLALFRLASRGLWTLRAPAKPPHSTAYPKKRSSLRGLAPQVLLVVTECRMYNGECRIEESPAATAPSLSIIHSPFSILNSPFLFCAYIMATRAKARNTASRGRGTCVSQSDARAIRRAYRIARYAANETAAPTSANHVNIPLMSCAMCSIPKTRQSRHGQPPHLPHGVPSLLEQG